MVPGAIRWPGLGSFARNAVNGPLMRDCSSKHAGNAESTHGPCAVNPAGVAAASGCDGDSTVGVPVACAETRRSGGASRCANTILPSTTTMSVASR